MHSVLYLNVGIWSLSCKHKDIIDITTISDWLALLFIRYMVII